MDTVLTADEAAARLKIQPRTMRIWLRAGKVKAVKFGREWRITEAEIQRLIKKGVA